MKDERQKDNIEKEIEEDKRRRS